MRLKVHISGAGRVTRMFKQREIAAESVSYSVEYTAEHAIPVHEDLDAYHEPPTQAKFLEAPFRALRKDMTDYIADAIRKGRTMRQGAYQAMRKLLSVSKMLCPIDTGELRGSARINSESARSMRAAAIVAGGVAAGAVVGGLGAEGVGEGVAN